MSLARRLSSYLFLAALAASVGVAFGASVDTSPLRWGTELRDYISQGEHPAAAAMRMHETFEGAKRARLVESADYLAEDDVIYLEPIEARLKEKRELAFQHRQGPAVDTRPPEKIELAANAELQPAGVYEGRPSGVESGHRIAEDIAGAKVIHFHSAIERGRQATRED